MLKSEEIRWFALRVGRGQQGAVFRERPEDGDGLFSPFDEVRQDLTDRQTANRSTPPEQAGRGVLGIARFQNGLIRAESQVLALCAGPTETNPTYQSQSYAPSAVRVRLSYGPHTGLKGNLEQVNKPLRVEFSGPPAGRATEAV